MASKMSRKQIDIGDRVRIIKRGEIYEGLLMPRIGKNNFFTIKLDNGYNIGINAQGAKIEIVQKNKETPPAKESAPLTPKKNLPSISVLGCGGTIVSRVEYTTGAVFPAFGKSDILKMFPNLENFANTKPRKLFDLLSEDMHPAHWQLIAKEVAQEIKSGADGVVLMHGTDTMHYTSAALSFMLQDLPVPVVLVGAQRSSDRGSSDNFQNLICAARGSLSNIAEVSVCMHATSSDDYCFLHQGTKVRKMHTSRRDAFRSMNSSPFAKIWPDGRIEQLRNDFKKRGDGKLRLDTKINPDVCLIQAHPGIKPEFISSLSKLFDGVVISGTGLGHVPTNPFGDKLAKSILPAVKSLISSGVAVTIAPQTIYGRVNMEVYTAGRLLEEAGAIGNYCDWTPETALVKLMWVLGHTKDPKEVKKIMLTNIAGEITERIKPETFPDD